jgi:hypothetical protein
MLTIKYIQTSGHEKIVPVNVVFYDPATGSNNEHPRGVVETESPEGDHMYDNGTIYVMNDHGSTISIYRLNA